MSYTSTIVGYTVLIGAAGAIYYYQSNKKRPGASQARPAKSSHPESRKERNAKKQRSEAFRTETHESGGERASKAAPAKTGETEPANNWLSNVDTATTTKDEVSNRDFAQRMAGVKEGTKLVARGSVENNNRLKSVKQSRVAKAAEFEEDKMSAPSSSTGMDADDDQSPALSPEVTAADAGDVTDMLERPAPGPSILRLTEPESAPKNPAPKKQAVPEHKETKKQRQNKKKAELAKAAREEAEQERKVKMEAQRRLARIAEGRPAKDGSGFMAAVNGAKNAWTNSSHGDNKPGAPPVTDLFQSVENTEQPATGSDGARSSTKEKSGSSRMEDSWMSTLPSEEEQLEMLKDTETWNTVKPTKAKKAKPAAADSDNITEQSAEMPVPGTAQAVNKPPPTRRVNGNPTKPAPLKKSYGSFTALSSNDLPEEEEEEEEWDV